MIELPITTTLLLDRLRTSGDSDSWREVDARYRPVLRGFGRALGLSDFDADDAAQWTLAEVARALRDGEYSRERGRLRSWIMGIARHRVQMIKRSSARRLRLERADATPDLPDDRSLSLIWDRELQRAVFEHAWRMIQAAGTTAEPNLRAFELVVLRGMPAERAAAECGMTADAVYLAKSRILRRLKDLVADLTRCYADDE